MCEINLWFYYCRLGFAGEVNPWNIIPSEVKRPKTGQITRVYSTSDPHQLYGVLVDFIHLLYFRYAIKIDPSSHIKSSFLIELFVEQTLFKGSGFL